VDSKSAVSHVFFGVLVGVVLMTLVIINFGYTHDEAHNEAVNAGHAEYYLDDKHERQWRWKDDGCVTSNRAEGAKEDE